MEYHESAAYLKSLQQRRPKFGTETAEKMLSYLGHPEDSIDCIQIGGSNGKGSTARMLESVLRSAGLDVGLFTSPSLNDFREQIRINGRKIPKQCVNDYVEAIDPCIERLRAEDDMPTHFEVLTAIAINHFGTEDVDVAMLEVGIGGRYDATSAVDPVAGAVTSVSLEHTDLLGDSVAEIARDKAQIAPSDTPLVTGTSGTALDAIQTETDVITVGQENATVRAVENGMHSQIESEVSITGPDWSVETHLPLLGQHQATNAGVAAMLARQVADVDPEIIEKGLRDAHWPGRFEIMATDPMVILDGSHNPGACSTLEDLLDRYEYDDLHVVFGAMRDKDHERMVAELPPVDNAYLTRPAVDRAEYLDVLADAFDGHAERIQWIESVLEATECAVATADEWDLVLVTGSLYAIAEARDRWTRLLVPKNRGRTALEQSVDFGTEFAQLSMVDIDYRSIKTYLRPIQAEKMKEAVDAVGGDCILLDVGAPGTFVAAVLSGTVAQFDKLCDELEQRGSGLAHVSRQLAEAIDTDPPTNPYIKDSETSLMGILNVTPDSFHDGGEYIQPDDAVQRAKAMVDAGADIIDVGGESTRPGADPVSTTEEKERVVPVIEEIAELGVPISIDTRKAAVADAALDAGADIVNDVSGLSDPAMRFVVAEHDASLVLMHSLDAPVDPDRNATYDNVVEDVLHELSEQILLAEQAGIDREQIIVDPGCGFGKDATASFELIDRLNEFRALGCPVMIGHSRKSIFEQIQCDGDEHLLPTLVTTALAGERGVDIARVHDVTENAAVIRTIKAIGGK